MASCAIPLIGYEYKKTILSSSLDFCPILTGMIRS